MHAYCELQSKCSLQTTITSLQFNYKQVFCVSSVLVPMEMKCQTTSSGTAVAAAAAAAAALAAVSGTAGTIMTTTVAAGATNTATTTASMSAVLAALCGACCGPICDRYIMRVVDTYYHEGCLQCTSCSVRLMHSCFARNGKLYCRIDYERYVSVYLQVQCTYIVYVMCQIGCNVHFRWHVESSGNTLDLWFEYLWVGYWDI